MLTKKKCIKALDSLKPMNIKEFRQNNYLSFVEASDVLEQLIEEHFDNQFLNSEVDLLISLLRPIEDELGMDITLLIDKLERIQNTLPKKEGIVTCVEMDFHTIF